MSALTNAVSIAGNVLPGTSSNRLLVLIYHRVHAQTSASFPQRMDAGRFDWQMDLVRKYCKPVGLRDGLNALRAGALAPRSVAVTFDDGYADNCEVALPILLKHGMQATFFVAPGFLDGGRMWNDSVMDAIDQHPEATIDLSRFGLGIRSLDSEVDRANCAQEIISLIKRLPPDDRSRHVSEISGRLGSPVPGDPMMTSSQVRKLLDSGMEVGAHTVSHPILRALDEQTMRREILDSRSMLEDILQYPVPGFAYPNGKLQDDYSARDRNMVEDLGFEYAVTTEWGVATATTDRFQLPRFTPWDTQPARWLLRLLSAFGNPRL